MPSDWITTTEAVRLTGYHLKHIQRLLRAGAIRARKWGRDWQVQRASLLAYQRAARQRGTKRGPKPHARQNML